MSRLSVASGQMESKRDWLFTDDEDPLVSGMSRFYQSEQDPWSVLRIEPGSTTSLGDWASPIPYPIQPPNSVSGPPQLPPFDDDSWMLPKNLTLDLVDLPESGNDELFGMGSFTSNYDLKRLILAIHSGEDSFLNNSTNSLSKNSTQNDRHIGSETLPEHGNQVSFSKNGYLKTAGFRRKAVRVLVNGRECFARPDSGSDRNIMTEAVAKEYGLEIQRGKLDRSTFKLGNSQYIQSTGRTLVPLKVLDGDSRADKSCWFHVLSKCSVPVIMGFDFVRKIQLYTKNRHLLVACPFSFGDIPSLKWIGSPQGAIEFSANGRLLAACADTGSDLDLMSLRCAIKKGFKVDRSRRTRVMLADETIVESVGQVDISSLQLPGFDSFEMSFHVLPNLVCDVIFGEEFLEQMDAFNTCDIVDSDDELDLYSLNPFINLGPVQAFLSAMANIKRSRKSRRDPATVNEGLATQHDNAVATDHSAQVEEEMYSRHQANRLISKMKDGNQAAIAARVEVARRQRFENKHINCVDCINRVGGSVFGMEVVNAGGSGPSGSSPLAS
ncbi:hypothetical protein EG329_009037 [Mollisiaceae sp. DMI_Dod_QoI]|nr:hypothetical protein EG329_009037 [Helotiales sp. DMI_Dod_QoI]